MRKVIFLVDNLVSVDLQNRSLRYASFIQEALASKELPVHLDMFVAIVL